MSTSLKSERSVLNHEEYQAVLATHHPATETIDEILQEADRAMYAAKSRRASDRRPPADRVATPLRLISPPASDAVDASAFGMDS